MSTDRPDLTRRALLLASAGLALPARASPRSALPAVPAAPAGKPGQFDFLEGSWNIQNRRLRPDTRAWDEFPGESTCWTVLGGAGSIEDLRIPARGISGLGIRLLDRERKVWTDLFVSGKSGVVTPPPVAGSLVDGVFTFVEEGQEGGAKVLYRGVWDRITRTSCRWFQSSSRDGGRTWADDWVMAWTRR
jgi:hypothetical protein